MAGQGSQAEFFARWLAAQPWYTGQPRAVGINVDGGTYQLLPPGGTPYIVSSVSFRNRTGNAGTLIIRVGSSSGSIMATLAAGEDFAIPWIDPGSLWYTVSGGSSDTASNYEVHWGA